MSIGKRALWLGMSQIIELGLQLVLPIILVRHISRADFGDYRFIWLVASAAASLAPMGMLDVLSMLLPRSISEEKRAHVAIAYLYMTIMAVLSGLLVTVSIHFFTATSSLHHLAIVAGSFTTLWVIGVLLDYLPVADERGDWQAKAAIGVALFRSIFAAGAAILYGSVSFVFWMLTLTAAFKVALLLHYGRKHHLLGEVVPSKKQWKHHVQTALPYGLSSTLYTARRQADQWIVAALMGTTQLATFSLAAVFGPLVLMVRRVVSSTLLPTMSKMEERGNWQAVLDVNNRANLAVAFFAAPGLAFLWCFGEPLYTLIYTSSYLDAVPVMRILTITWLLQIVELNSIILLAGQMPYSARLSLPLLVTSALLSLFLGHTFGILGAAAGGVIIAALERVLLVRRLSQALQIPVRKLQNWKQLIGLLIVSWSLAAAGRLVFSLVPLDLPPILTIAGIAILLAPPYFVIAWKSGWLPHKLMQIPTE